MRLFLAPMDGVGDHVMRAILTRFGGIDLCVTEFIRVNDHVLPNRVFTSYCPELLPDSARTMHTTRVPVRVQLLGSDPHLLAENARKVAAMGAVGVDLNFGCPAKTVNRHRGGACLLQETGLLYEIVARVREAVPVHLPVTAKIRLGYEDRSSYLQNALAIEKAGASELVVHARSKADGYNPPAYWSYIAEINEALTIPVVANGEIWTVDDYLRCKSESKSRDFMLGRGLLAKPDLAFNIKALAEGRPYRDLHWQEIIPRLHEFFVMSSLNATPKHCGSRLKQWLYYLKRTYPEAERMFETIKRVRDFKELDAFLLRAMAGEVG